VSETPSATGTLDFIRAKIEEDRRSGRYGGRVATRFPPEPNGYLHIGHAKSICLNFGIAQEFGGTCNLRFDDTNPTTENVEFVESIKEDVCWLGFQWDNLHHASDYFQQLYDWAELLIREGKAYVCSLSEEEIREYRGTVTEAGRPSPYRERSVEENLDLFRRMRAGEFADGEHVLRARIDMANANMKMRDPLLYRIRRDAHHYRTGQEWPIYPMYDWAHGQGDAIEKITHSLCTLEFENNRELYDWFVDNLPLPEPPRQTEFARLNLTYTVLSKRKLKQLVEGGHVSGWNDPRMPTISGFRRRGYTPEAIRTFCDMIGVAKANSTVDMVQLEYAVRDDLNQKAPRVLCVLDPLKVVITNYPEGQTEALEAPYYPHDVPKEGSRTLPFEREIFIERDDFQEKPAKKFFRLAPGREVRLRYAYVIRCDAVIKNAAGEVVELHCSYDPETRGGNVVGRKVSGTIHWVSATQGVPVPVRIYDRLFRVERPGENSENFLDDLNPNSLQVLETAYLEPAAAQANPGDHFQFERQGYFVADPVDSKPGSPAFNRTVPLRDSWAKLSAETSPAPKTEATAPPKPAKQAPATPTPPRQRGAEAKERIAAFQALGVPPQEAEVLTDNPGLARFFEQARQRCDAPAALANVLVNEVRGIAPDGEVSRLPFEGDAIGELVALVEEGTITGKIAKEVLAHLVEKGGSPREIVAAKGLQQLDDADALEALVAEVLEAHPGQLGQYRDGKTALFGFFVGQVMKRTQGRANPGVVNALLKKRLG
jgi:glutaminyl-tRNA synthetase